MIDSKVVKDLFKPYELHFMGLQDLLDATKLSRKQFLRIRVQDECTKSIDESCINNECPHNFVEMHEHGLYVEVFKEVEQERIRVQEQVKRDMEKFYGR